VLQPRRQQSSDSLVQRSYSTKYWKKHVVLYIPVVQEVKCIKKRERGTKNKDGSRRIGERRWNATGWP
jgi:hypothetical protein